jgi:hypothetical protein
MRVSAVSAHGPSLYVRLPTTVRLIYGANLPDSNDSEASSEDESLSINVTLLPPG